MRAAFVRGEVGAFDVGAQEGGGGEEGAGGEGGEDLEWGDCELWFGMVGLKASGVWTGTAQI